MPDVIKSKTNNGGITMSIFSQLASRITVKEFIEQELNDGTGSFPVVVVQGPVISLGRDGSTRITKRDNVRIPMFGYEMDEVKEVFPEIGKKITGVKIEQFVLPEAREWENPETGEIITVQYGYRIVPTDGSLPQAPSRRTDYPESVGQRPKEQPPIESQVFSGSSRSNNDLQPQI